MQYLTIIVSLLATSIAAKHCKLHGSYCGSSLLRKDSYYEHIVATLKAEGQPFDWSHISNSRFECLHDGDIAYREYCSQGCGGTNSATPDYCLTA